MKFLYVPWRSKYVKDIREEKKENATKDECPFCVKVAENNDAQHFILGRFKYNFIILNLHPYNTGHILIIPFEHIKSLEEMSLEGRIELIELTTKANEILRRHLNAQGINVGANFGKAAGAGIPAHLHLHIIPRWEGDTNFLPLIANTKTISLDLNKVYNDLKPHFEALTLTYK